MVATDTGGSLGFDDLGFKVAADGALVTVTRAATDSGPRTVQEGSLYCLGRVLQFHTVSFYTRCRIKAIQAG